jgi:transcriptional regulator with XRE-family HTH domain
MLPAKSLPKFVGEAVRSHRKAKLLTQEQLAEEADISEKMVGFIERGERNTSVVILDQVAHGLGVSLWKLLRDAEHLRQKAGKSQSR